MFYKDRIYGEIEITEPVILELIKSQAVQRLKGIDQAGYKKHWVKPETKMDKLDHTRFAHSLGVCIILKKYGASLQEQIAGLIHDVSHSAFSHSIDYILDVGSEAEHNYQDNIFEEYIKKTKIPEIFKKYNVDIDYILNDFNFPLLEKNLPDLCADRIDYSLRTAVLYGEKSQKEISDILDNLITQDSQWIFKDFESAKEYAGLFIKLNSIYYASLKSAIMFRTVGDYIKYALQKGYINGSDLYTTDDLVLSKIGKYLDRDNELRLLFDRLENKVTIRNNPRTYDVQVICKSRVVDPLFLENNKSMRVSEIDKDFVAAIRRESVPKKYFLKFDK